MHNVYEDQHLWEEVKVARSGLGRGQREMPGPQSSSQGSRELPRILGCPVFGTNGPKYVPVLLPLVVCSSGTRVTSGKGSLQLEASCRPHLHG